ncbi:bifunctional ADP-dependent NAD(P)H-hydrate dehydratase/NAD(P)H-hydrate epimerase [Actinotalea sp.]|uniref:bifunctional ADP-dependent NAD(P)H-hydrate dehydratase/NAD(P)H-hydrate epimerase n=1 Tax=Actinotalea sp. TaxID=1872145 RepID=UPI003561ABA6
MREARTADHVRSAELPLLALERGFSGGLMHRAAWALAAAARRELTADGVRPAGASVVGLVGGGNNGGDTLYALALLAARGVRATAIASGPVHEGGLAALTRAGGQVLAVDQGAPGEQVWLGDALAEAFGADLVLDGLLGIGARGGLRGTPARIVELLTGLLAAVEASEALPRVIAVDVPSGIGVDDGTIPGPVLPADRTVTFGVAKAGLLLPPATALAGRVEVVDLGLAEHLDALGAPAVLRMEAEDVAGLWPVPGPADDKYRRGVLGVVAGSTGYPGAAVLTVDGALGAGCGMIRYLGPRRATESVVAAHPEVVAAEGRVQAWVLGPGVAGDKQQERVAAVLAALGDLPAVVDAGALGCLPARVGPRVVLTPHAGELATLLKARGADVDRAAVEAEPLRWATEAQRSTGATVLLKGSTTIVVGPQEVWSQAEAVPWLATAGSGDVLAGVLGALLAGSWDAIAQDASLVARLAAAAAFVHGRAAHEANPGGPVRASGVAATVPAVVARLLS